MKRTSGTGRICWVVDLGLIPYGPACDLQRASSKRAKAGAIPDVLLLCEHPHVITLGRNGKREHLRAGRSHAWGRCTSSFIPPTAAATSPITAPVRSSAIPILDLAEHRRDVRWYRRATRGSDDSRDRRFRHHREARQRAAHGVWVDTPAGEEKLAALGVHLSRWVTSHGFAYNVSTDLRYFDLIVPCGIPDKRATSLERLLGRAVSSQEVRPRIWSSTSEKYSSAP